MNVTTRTKPSFTALLWLDYRQFVNRVRTIGRNPRRLIPWLVILLWFVPSLATRVLFGTRIRGRRATSSALLKGLGAIATFIPGLTLFLVSLNFWRAPSRPPIMFQSGADARFVLGAGYDPRLIVAWLSLRNGRRVLLSGLVYGLFLLAIFIPGLGLRPEQAIAGALGLALLFACVIGAQLSAFAMRRRLGIAPAQALGLAGLLVAVASMANATLAGLGSDPLEPALRAALAAVPPGSWVVEAFRGDPLPDVYLAASALLLNGAGVVGSADSYPELWETSSRAFVIRRAARQGGGLFAALSARRELRRRDRPAGQTLTASSSSRFVPPGPWVLLWKEWLATRRQAGGTATQVLIMTAAVVGGLLVGYLQSHASGRTAPLLTLEIPLLVLLFSAVLTVRMGVDLRNPLWWLTDSSLLARLAAWTLARALRVAIPVVLFVEADVLFGQRAPTVLVALPIAVISLAWLIQAVGVAGYAVLPASADFRLAQMLRVLAIYVVLVSMAIPLVAGLVAHSVLLVILLPSLMAAAESVLFLLFATWRIQGNGLAFAREERQ